MNLISALLLFPIWQLYHVNLFASIYLNLVLGIRKCNLRHGPILRHLVGIAYIDPYVVLFESIMKGVSNILYFNSSHKCTQTCSVCRKHVDPMCRYWYKKVKMVQINWSYLPSEITFPDVISMMGICWHHI